MVSKTETLLGMCMNCGAEVEITVKYPDVAALRARLAEAERERDDLRIYFNLSYKAERRGEEMFLDAHPEYRERLALPGTDRLVCWLLEQLAAYESRDETWRGKKEMLENDLAKAWERAERAERVWGIVGRMRERVLNRPPGVIIPMWVHDAIEEAEAIRLANEPESWKESKDGME